LVTVVEPLVVSIVEPPVVSARRALLKDRVESPVASKEGTMKGIDDILGHDLVVRRAQASDAGRVADFVNRALRGRVTVQPRAVISRLGEVGFLVAQEDDALLGLVGWHVENLVACVTDVLIWPAHEREVVGRALFEEMEAQAIDLQAETALLFLPPSRFSELMPFCASLGYRLHRVGELPRAWREMAHQAGREDDDQMPVKQLRSDRVVRPL
jgi:N-acetylglutamate synthase-like GNAT family acetyltransferase